MCGYGGMETVCELSIYIQTLVPFTLLDNLCQKNKRLDFTYDKDGCSTKAGFHNQGFTC